MSLIPVRSSAVRLIGYDAFRGVLAVVFVTSDEVYLHPDVPWSVFSAFMNARSKGAYYNTHIKGRYG